MCGEINQQPARGQKKPESPGKHFHQVQLIKDDLRPSGALTKAEVCLCAYGMSAYCVLVGV